MATTRRFIQVDVFSPIPTQGNGLAVVVDAEGLDDSQLQAFAAWTNLAETTFLLPPEDPAADYRVRIFTPSRELPFAGHPTLGSCAAWLHVGGEPHEPGMVRQECGIGVVDIDLTGGLAFVAPPTTIEPLDGSQLRAITDALGIDSDLIVRSARLDNGPVFPVIHLASAEDVLELDSSRVRWPTFDAIGFIGPHTTGSECDYEVRLLAPSSGMSEDPITGSLNAALAFWLREAGLLAEPLTISQGTAIGRHGRVYIRPTGDSILIGGDTHILIVGDVTL
ncbi:MAG TPA: PhzF family phenazine biosynthesis protein [Acidimicrobiia bacterium]|jgi:PhzF family phenazine biosynthesis protein|nr:PhzF family phenazine biosynthesis protein [Acidimicrobiia bacterium]